MAVKSSNEQELRAKADLLLHPVRSRIVEVIAGRQLTARQISNAMADTAQTTLYRYLKELVSAGFLSVVSERPVRGTVEKLYALGERSTFINAEEAEFMSAEDWMRTCKYFTNSILGDFARYLQKPDANPTTDSVGFNKLVFDLTFEELSAFVTDLRALLKEAGSKPEREGSKRYNLGLSIMPGETMKFEGEEN